MSEKAATITYFKTRFSELACFVVLLFCLFQLLHSTDINIDQNKDIEPSFICGQLRLFYYESLMFTPVLSLLWCGWNWRKHVVTIKPIRCAQRRQIMVRQEESEVARGTDGDGLWYKTNWLLSFVILWPGHEAFISRRCYVLWQGNSCGSVTLQTLAFLSGYLATLGYSS